MSELGPDVLAYVMANFGDDYVFDMAISYLPCQVFERLTFDQAAKIRHSASRNFDSKTHDAFDANPSHELLRKIKSSIWRWSLNDKRDRKSTRLNSSPSCASRLPSSA